MNALEQHPAERPSQIERTRFRPRTRQPLFVADWTDALFLHYEVEGCRLRPFVPFELDLWQGRAFVSLVAFTMRGMRFARFGAPGAWICRPIATHEFLNLRTYVRHGEDAGICFLSEWLPNRLSLLFGPTLYALPYRHAAIQYIRHDLQLRGSVAVHSGCLRYEGNLHHKIFEECSNGSLDHFLLERYVAFNAGHFTCAKINAACRLFRVWHEPWLQARATVRVIDDSLLRNSAPWWPAARLVSANYSPGVCSVWMSAPRRLPLSCI
jgi:hypothetical protein